MPKYYILGLECQKPILILVSSILREAFDTLTILGNFETLLHVDNISVFKAVYYNSLKPQLLTQFKEW